jgi:Uma2 family endonuclease
MPSSALHPADALAAVRGRAEIVRGRVERMSPTGGLPARAGAAIYASLRAHEEQAGGRAYPDNAAFLVDLPGRGSFSPDASFHAARNVGMDFIEGAPVFAAEVRSKGDYGAAAEAALAAKRAEYFAAGTVVVWDVDLLGPDTVRSYRATAPEDPTVYRRGDVAAAEPALPGWSMTVEELFG